MIKYFLLLTLILFSTNVLSDNYIHGGMWSKHPVEGLNERHNLIGIEIDGYFLHKFENSFNDTSYFVGKIDRDILCFEKLCAGYSVGVLHGYEVREFMPVVFAVFSYEIDRFGVDINYLPDIVTTIQFRYKVEW